MTDPSVLFVALGGAIGALLRFGLSQLGSDSARPWIIAGVNIVGSFIAGTCSVLIADETLRLALLTGFCGGFTTFSTASTDTAKSLRSGDRTRVIALLVVNAVITVAFAWLGVSISSALLG